MPLREPPLYDVHASSGAEFTDFGGWSMPVSFDGIAVEHHAVRQSAGIFDVSHMSEIDVAGPDATELMNRLTTNDVRALEPGDAHYACILNNDGILLDDTVVYRYPEREGYLFVPNAGHGKQLCSRWQTHADDWGLEVSVRDRTRETGLLAVQGPDAPEAVTDVASDDVGDQPRFSSRRTTIAGRSCLVARTGYTGEDGFEIFIGADASSDVWAAFADLQPCGLGARDTLRLEAGLLLSGQDFDPDDQPRTPLEAGLEFVVDCSSGSFVGKDALQRQRETGVDEHVVGITVQGRGIARSGHPIRSDGDQIGVVTSGTMSPTFNTPLALGYVDDAFTATGTAVDVQIRDRAVEATVVDQRFLDAREVP